MSVGNSVRSSELHGRGLHNLFIDTLSVRVLEYLDVHEFVKSSIRSVLQFNRGSKREYDA